MASQRCLARAALALPLTSRLCPQVPGLGWKTIGRVAFDQGFWSEPRRRIAVYELLIARCLLGSARRPGCL
jgi:hypothetical protein